MSSDKSNKEYWKEYWDGYRRIHRNYKAHSWTITQLEENRELPDNTHATVSVDQEKGTTGKVKFVCENTIEGKKVTASISLEDSEAYIPKIEGKISIGEIEHTLYFPKDAWGAQEFLMTATMNMMHFVAADQRLEDIKIKLLVFDAALHAYGKENVPCEEDIRPDIEDTARKFGISQEMTQRYHITDHALEYHRKNESVHHGLLQRGIKEEDISHYRTNLYVPVTLESKEYIEKEYAFPINVETFRDNITQKMSYDIPFAARIEQNRDEMRHPFDALEEHREAKAQKWLNMILPALEANKNNKELLGFYNRAFLRDDLSVKKDSAGNFFLQDGENGRIHRMDIEKRAREALFSTMVHMQKSGKKANMAYLENFVRNVSPAMAYHMDNGTVTERSLIATELIREIKETKEFKQACEKSGR